MMMLPLENEKAVLVPPMSKLLALDQSSKTTGYTVLNNGKIVEVSHFTCTGDDLGARLVQLKKEIGKLIQKYEIDEVVFEDIQLQDVNGNKEVGIKTFKVLAETFGVVHEYLTANKIPYTAVQPIKWKAHFKIAGKGRAQEKKMTQEYVAKNYNIKCTEDEADSLCIALYYESLNNSFDWS